jgi:hypothetical protein
MLDTGYLMVVAGFWLLSDTGLSAEAWKAKEGHIKPNRF